MLCTAKVIVPVHGGHYAVLPLVRAGVKLSVHLSHGDALGIELVDYHFFIAEALNHGGCVATA